MIENFKDITVISGEKIELTAKISGVPPPNVTWSRNDQSHPLDESFKLQTNEEYFTMIKDNCLLNDDGTYKLTAVNEGGSIEITGRVTVLQAPQIKEEMKSPDVIQGNSVKLHVTFDGTPTPSVSWHKDSSEIGESDRVKISHTQDSASLEIKNSTFTDAGTYSAIVTNSVGVAQSTGNMNILVPPTVSGFLDQIIIEGAELILQCRIEGVPAPNVKLLKNKKEVKEDATTKFLIEEGVFSMKKLSSSLDEEAKYVIQVENSAGKAEATCQITVLTPPTFQKELADETLLDNGDLSLEVVAIGKPVPNLQWQKDGSDVKPDKRIKVVKKAGTSSLVIKKVESTDAGEYLCLAQNDAGEKTTKATVAVNSKPQVLKKLKDITLHEDETLTLETQFKGFPEPDVAWLKDDETLPLDNMKKEGTNCIFQVDNVKLECSGVYTAVAKNLVGDCKTSAKVKVIKQPYFIKPLSDITVIEKQNLKLDADIGGFPDPDIEWMKDGKPINLKKSSGPEKPVLKKEGNNYSLSLTKVSVENEGIYSIIAKNQAGEVKCQASVVVQGMY